jgi:tRNA pseudouridine38-40 synthase
LKLKATLCYDGSYFAGFARQKSIHNTVINELELALNSVGINSQVLGAGRTDKGVHAVAQTISFNIPSYWQDLNKLQHALNNKINPKMHIASLICVPNNFEVRFDATSRTYRYLIRTKPYSVFWAKYAWHIDGDWSLSAKAIRHFIGEKDFTSFCKVDNSKQSSHIRQMLNAKVCKWSDGVAFVFKANGFLRSQVRMMSAFLVEIANARLSEKDLILQLNNEVKVLTKPAPPEGLYLSKIIY